MKAHCVDRSVAIRLFIDLARGRQTKSEAGGQQPWGVGDAGAMNERRGLIGGPKWEITVIQGGATGKRTLTTHRINESATVAFLRKLDVFLNPLLAATVALSVFHRLTASGLPAPVP